ncbi:MAG: N-acetylmuramoyl-L-alanine amidase-like domain-containing protein [Akkermansiaceae bacterium]
MISLSLLTPKKLTSRLLAIALSTLSLSILSPHTQAAEMLPQSVTFIGQQKFQQISQKAIAGNWRALPMGDRMAKIALELQGIPYKAYTLEIHNKIESPSVNFSGLDCWTFFETVMGMAKMLETPKKSYTHSDLLAQIEHTRYRGGVCKGNYLDRIHYLAEWYKDNDKRKNIDDITRKFPTVTMPNQCNEMSLLWKHYRYLKHNPELRPLMAQSEREITAMTVKMVPKSKVPGIEKHLKNGDIIGIARHGNGSYCSHVGIIIKDDKGQARFMHASTTYKKVVVDSTISGYLNKFKKHAGILIARPR